MTQRRFQPPSDLPAPFGRYQLLKLLGRGGMGSVYLALDSQLDRRVALKIPLLDPTDGSQVLERFYREARAAATIHHPNVCPIYDVGDCDGVPYLTMAFIDGKPLAAFAEGGKLTPRQAALLVRKIALALAEAHQQKVIHRDLKPANIMVDRRSEPIVMDFGLARRSKSGDVRMTQEGATLGTPAYMPPEQVSGNVDLMGPRSDIYSLGVVLYELLAGRLPFSGDVMAVLSQVLLDEPPPPSKFRPGIDSELDAICKKAMAKKMEDRFASMKEMAAALQEYVRSETQAAALPAVAAVPENVVSQGEPRQEGIRVSALGGMRSMDQVYADLPQRPAPERRPKRSKPKRNRRRWPVLLLIASVSIVLLLAVGGVALYYALHQSSEELGILRLQMVPNDAAVKIEIDGVPDHHHGDLLSLRPGTHRLTVYGKDWQPVHRAFDVTPGNNSPLRVVLLKVKEEVGPAGGGGKGATKKTTEAGKGAVAGGVAFTTPDGRFKAEFPAQPKETEEKGSKGVVKLFTATKGTSTYSIAVSHFPETANATAEALEKHLDSVRDAAVANLKSKLVWQEKVQLEKKYPGRDVVFELAGGAQARERFFLVGTTLYQIMVRGAGPDERRSKEAIQFLDSFHLAK